MWLKPGKRYLFGRVKKNDVRFAIDHKTVSRQHFIIEVAEVKSEDVGRIHARTKITITDQASKSGTHVDGKLLKDESHEAENDVISVRPGSCPHELLIKWEPYVLTYGLQKKELKTGVLKTKQERVKDLDVKAVSDFLTAETTHLVAQKRNTPKGLQALIEGRPIVTDAYIDALIYFAAPTNIEADENLCPLEIDFDANWPDPVSYLPAPGKEPTDKPPEAYKPVPSRKTIFEKHFFVFFDQSQYDTLLPPITTGHGKALFFKTTPNKTTCEEGLDFIRKAAGPGGHIIIIRLADSTEHQDWLKDYINRLAAELGQESASQSDLLDTILANDASQLRKKRDKPTNAPDISASDSAQHPQATESKPSQTADTQISGGAKSVPGSRPSSSDLQVSLVPSPRPASALQDSRIPRQVHPHHPPEDPSPRPRKRPRFVPSQRKADPFDDDFNPDAIAAFEDEDSLPEAAQGRTSHTRKLHFENDDVVIKDESIPRDDHGETVPSKIVSDSEEELLDQLLPAAAAMRKEKQRQDAEPRRQGLPIYSTLSVPEAADPVKTKKEVKLLNVREEARAWKDAKDQAYERERQDLERMQEEYEGQTGPANLVRIVHFDLPVRKRGENRTDNSRGAAWKPEWEGRKNFKGFRRARDVANGVAGGSRSPRDKIIVTTVAVGKDGRPLSDEPRETHYKNIASNTRHKSQIKQSGQSQPRRSQRSSTVNGDDGSNAAASDHSDTDHSSSETTHTQREAEGVLDDPINVDAPRQTRGGDTLTQSSWATATSTARSMKGAKRSASKSPADKLAWHKKQRTASALRDDDSDRDPQSDDSDDMAFKFGRAGRVRLAK